MKTTPGPPPARRLIEQPELQLSIFVRTGDMYGGRPLYHEIIDRAQRACLRGATAARGLQGFGASANLRRPGLGRMTGHEPVLIEVTDDAAKVRGFLPSVEELTGGAPIVLKTVITVRVVADLPDIATSALT